MAFLWPADYYPHYAAFLEPFLVCALALPAARLGALLAVPSADFGLSTPLDAVRRAPCELRRIRVRAAPLLATLKWPVLVFVSSRVLLMVMAVVEAHVRHQPFMAQFASWDGQWYGALALHGYPTHAGNLQTTLGFFPLYPLVVRRVAGVIAHFGAALPFGEQINLAGLVVSGVGGVIATVLIQRLATAWWGVRSGRRAVVVFCFFPGSVVFSMVYAEGLLIPLAAGCILALQRRRWVSAGVLAGLATATAPIRPTCAPPYTSCQPRSAIVWPNARALQEKNRLLRHCWRRKRRRRCVVQKFRWMVMGSLREIRAFAEIALRISSQD